MNKTYADYLIEKGLRTSYIQTHMKVTNEFIAMYHNLEGFRYNDVLDYINFQHEKGIKRSTTQKRLAILSTYFDYLKQEGKVFENPFRAINYRGTEAKKLHNILSQKQLLEMYNECPKGIDKVIIGLYVFQGITTTELRKLELRHINLDEGFITIEGTSKSNTRTLSLSPKQILDLYSYSENAKTDSRTQRLITNSKGESNIQGILQLLTNKLKSKHEYFESVKQVRASVITRWVKTLNLREAQYRAGHRFVSSTEKYKVNDLEELEDEIERFHPLG